MSTCASSASGYRAIGATSWSSSACENVLVSADGAGAEEGCGACGAGDCAVAGIAKATQSEAAISDFRRLMGPPVYCDRVAFDTRYASSSRWRARTIPHAAWDILAHPVTAW